MIEYVATKDSATTVTVLTEFVRTADKTKPWLEEKLAVTSCKLSEPLECPCNLQAVCGPQVEYH
jgi:hypothetical protein